ncbi:MAG: YaeQ family protein [Burkholderiaceae bacterium]|nr:YaeQ family protein [Burkholderiaceae bacterium]
MALKATIFKASLQIADIDRNHYHEYPLTLARHPSETDERMMVRLLAFALFANEQLAFGKGLSSDDEPDLWQKDLTGVIELWLEAGLPDEKRLRQACGRAQQVVVLCYGSAADVWWSQQRSKLERLTNLTVLRLPVEGSQALARLAERTMTLQCTVQDGQMLWTGGDQTVAVEPLTWKPAAA